MTYSGITRETRLQLLHNESVNLDFDVHSGVDKSRDERGSGPDGVENFSVRSGNLLPILHVDDVNARPHPVRQGCPHSPLTPLRHSSKSGRSARKRPPQPSHPPRLWRSCPTRTRAGRCAGLSSSRPRVPRACGLKNVAVSLYISSWKLDSSSSSVWRSIALLASLRPRPRQQRADRDRERPR